MSRLKDIQNELRTVTAPCRQFGVFEYRITEAGRMALFHRDWAIDGGE